MVWLWGFEPQLTDRKSDVLPSYTIATGCERWESNPLLEGYEPSVIIIRFTPPLEAGMRIELTLFAYETNQNTSPSHPHGSGDGIQTRITLLDREKICSVKIHHLVGRIGIKPIRKY